MPCSQYSPTSASSRSSSRYRLSGSASSFLRDQLLSRIERRPVLQREGTLSSSIPSEGAERMVVVCMTASRNRLLSHQSNDTSTNQVSHISETYRYVGVSSCTAVTAPGCSIGTTPASFLRSHDTALCALPVAPWA